MADDNQQGSSFYRGYLAVAVVLAAVTWNAGSLLAEKPVEPNIIKAWPSLKLDTTVEHNESQDDRYITALRKAATP